MHALDSCQVVSHIYCREEDAKISWSCVVLSGSGRGRRHDACAVHICVLWLDSWRKHGPVDIMMNMQSKSPCLSWVSYSNSGMYIHSSWNLWTVTNSMQIKWRLWRFIKFMTLIILKICLNQQLSIQCWNVSYIRNGYIPSLPFEVQSSQL